MTLTSTYPKATCVHAQSQQSPNDGIINNNNNNFMITLSIE